MVLKNKINLFFALILFLNIEMNSQVPLPNLKYWFKCDSFVVKDNLNNVISWKNSIDTTQILSNSNLINSPTFTNNTIHFDGINDYLSLNFSFIVQPISYVIFWQGGISIDAQLVIDGISSSNRNSLIYYYPPYFPSVGIYSGTNLIDYPKTTFNNPIISTLIFNNTNSSIYENGNLKISNIDPGPNNMNGLIIGSRFDYFFPLNGDISEILIYNKVLSNNEINTINNYLINKYSHPVELGDNINILNNFCDIILSPSQQYESYLWSNGATTPTITVNTTGKYWLKATNSFGKVTSDTINVSFPCNLPQDLNLCGNQPKDWNTQLPKNQFAFQWQDNSTDSLITINSPGKYSVKIKDHFGCEYSSDTITINVDLFPSNASLGPDISLCAGNSIMLKQGLQPNLTYTWSTGENTSAITVTNTGQYAVAVTNTNNCVAKDTIQVNIIGEAPKADFLYSNACVKSVVSFSSTSNPPLGNVINSYEWNFENPSGTVNSSSLTNPFHTYADTGYYNVQLHVKTNIGCEQTITKTLHIAPTPTVNFTNGIACQKDSTVFVNLSLGSNSYSVASVRWDFGDPSSGLNNTSFLNSPKHVFANRGNHSIKLIATNEAGCKDSISKSIFIKDQVNADFSYQPACQNRPTIFQDQSIAPASSPRLWNFGNNFSNGLTATNTYSNIGTYSVALTVNGTNGCISKTTKSIMVYLPPISNFSVPNFCTKDTVTAVNLSIAKNGTITSYDWKMNQTSFSALSQPRLTTTQTGSLSIKLTVTNSFNCVDSITKTIQILPLPSVDFTIHPTAFYYIDSLITFYPTITNGRSYVWYFDGKTPITTQTPTLSFNSPGTYSCSLWIENQEGCENLKTKTISVQRHYLDVAVLNTQTTKDVDGFMVVKADIANYGSVPINSINLHYQINDAGNIKEIWKGVLNPNTIYTYTFNSRSADQNDKTNKITCVYIEKVNGLIDQNSLNNQFCNALNLDEITVQNPLPNPTDGDITIPVILNKDVDFSISIYNATGQIMSPLSSYRGSKGLNFIHLSTTSYSRGNYIIRVIIDEQTFIKKFIKLKED